MRKIIGPDVSFYQDDPKTPGGIDFTTMDRLTDFVIVRAGQNLWVDTEFQDSWRGAKEVGLPRGSYWFFDSRADPKRQAELWVDTLQGDLGELPLFLDIEEVYKGSFSGWNQWKDFLERLRALVGQKEIGIYTAYYYWRDNAPSASTQPSELEYFHRYPLWIANYSVDNPLVPKPWNTDEWLFWQFTAMGDGLSYGVESKEIDLNYFNGDALAFARRFNVPVPQDPPGPEPIGKRYIVNVRSLYVREGPGTNFKALGFLSRDDIVEALDANFNRTWLNIRRLSDGLTGWSSATYLVEITVPPPPPPDVPPQTGERYKVTASRLHVREGPGTNFTSLGFVELNDFVYVIGSNADGSWKNIRRSDGLVGWSSSRYLTPAPLPPEPPPDMPPTTGERYRVTTSKLHVREGPGTNFTSLGFVQLNDFVYVIGSNADGSWKNIRRSDGLVGWSYGRYLTPDPLPEPLPEPGLSDWYRVTASSLNVRENPELTARMVGSLSRDEIVQSLSTNTDQTWVQVRKVDGLTGWSSAQYLVNVGKTPATARQSILRGVTYYRNESAAPRRIVSHVLVLDMQTTKLSFLVTPPMRTTLPPLCTRTTSGFLTDQALQIAINGDGFYYLDPAHYSPLDYCPDGGDPVRLVGFAASRGEKYSPKATGRPILYINQNNKVSFNEQKGNLYNALSGDRMLAEKGKRVAGLEAESLHPRTAVGMNQNGRWLIMAVVDGREYSEGMSFPELADLMLLYGAYTAMSLDGGGSSTMVIEGRDGTPRVLSTLIDEGVPGRERAVANHLGIFIKK